MIPRTRRVKDVLEILPPKHRRLRAVARYRGPTVEEKCMSVDRSREVGVVVYAPSSPGETTRGGRTA